MIIYIYVYVYIYIYTCIQLLTAPPSIVISNHDEYDHNVTDVSVFTT